jgi:hypothetical protein
MPAADKLADYAEDHAPPHRIRTMRDFRAWVQANRTAIEERVLFGTKRRCTKNGWITPTVVGEAWRKLRERRKR